MRKAQISTLDLIFAVSLFVLVVILFEISWDSVLSAINMSGSENYQHAAYRIMDDLLETPGDPRDWNSSNVNMIGIAKSRDVIDGDKFVSFVDIVDDNYTRAKELLGVSSYEFYGNLSYPNGTGIVEFGLVPVNGTEIAVANGIALYKGNYANDKIVVLTIKVWK